MTFREKSAAVTLAVLVFVYGGYFLKVLAWDSPPPLGAVNGMLVGAVVSLVVLLVAAHIVMSAIDRRQREDERDRLIELIAERNGGVAVAFCAVSAIFILLMGPPRGAALNPVDAIHALLGALVWGEIVKRISQLYLYRRGV